MKQFYYILVVLVGVVTSGYLLIHQQAVAPSAIYVYAGPDQTICYNEELQMATLHASITGDVTDGDWLTFGDGKFMPVNSNTVRFSTTQSQQITYVPGPNDLALGYYRMMLLSDAPVGNPLERVTDEVRVNFQVAPPIVCSGNFSISLNESCTQKIDVSLLISNPVAPFTNYTVELYDAKGNIIPNNTVTKKHINTEVSFKLGHRCTGNICWGKFTVVDFFPPIFVCKNDTIPCTQPTMPDSLGFPIPKGAYIDTIINNKYVVKDWDKCSDVTLEYSDETSPMNCANGEDRKITRKWKARDAQGNSSTCNQLIVVKTISLKDISFPVNFDGTAAPSFECGDTFPHLANGFPSPDTTGVPFTGLCDHLQFQYSDLSFDMCGSGYKVVRNWFIINWCNSLSIDHNQIITVRDSKAPVIVCQDTIYLEASPYGCHTDKVKLPLLTSASDCSDFEISYRLTDSTGLDYSQFITKENGVYYFDHLPVNNYYLNYSATDVCNNSSVCTTQIVVRDLIAPFPACDGHTKVALDNQGRARVFAVTFDDKSTDNCGIAGFRARRMTDLCGTGTEWGDFVEFCCADIGTTQMVALEITDIHGNKNTCMVEVNVEDKIKPTIICPPDITLECTDNYDFEHLDIFGTVVNDPAKRKEIIINNYYHQGVVGLDGLATDNCSVEVTSHYTTDIECQIGYIYRTFIATDKGGRQDSCVQTITILNPQPFSEEDITWPDHFDGIGCGSNNADPSVTGYPVFDNTSCANVAYTYTDQLFLLADGACVKILRTWDVIDWCQFNYDNKTGKYGPYVQIIKLTDGNAPTFTSSLKDTTYCLYTLDCSATEIQLSASAVDSCTDSSALVWTYQLDINNDSVIDKAGSTSAFTELIPVGQHAVRWTVSDQCGNVSSGVQHFSVVDCKKPTPYCIEFLSVSLDEVKGFSEIWAKDFDKGSHDNCTDDTHLVFTFNEAHPVKDSIDRAHYFKGNGELATVAEYFSGDAQLWNPDMNSSGMYFDCSHIPNGKLDTVVLNMNVTDLIGNADYCTVQLLIQDNYDLCPDLITSASVSGRIMTENGKVPTNVLIYAEAGEFLDSALINKDGTYYIQDLPLNNEYVIRPHLDEDPLAGVTALDLVLIQKHILGLAPFTSPYQFIAADANKTKSVTAADISEIRKLILGVTNTFPKDIPAWLFVDAKSIENPTHPYNFRSYVETGVLTDDMIDQDFVAVKMGDINRSAITNLHEGWDARTISAPYTFYYKTVTGIEGPQVVITAGEDIDMDALTVKLSQLEAIEIKSIEWGETVKNMEADYVAINDHLNFILYNYQPATIKKGDIICRINVAHLDEFNLNPGAGSEIISDMESRHIRFVPGSAKKAYKLLVNPVVHQLILSIDSPENDLSNYEIINSEGKTFGSGVIDMVSGLNDYYIDLSANMRPGSYFIRLHSGDDAAILKFIKLD